MSNEKTITCNTEEELKAAVREHGYLLTDGCGKITLSKNQLMLAYSNGETEPLNVDYWLGHPLRLPADKAPTKNKYLKEIKPGVFVDVYDVLAAFEVDCQAMGHAIKKCLMPGARGVKSSAQDKQEAIKSIERSIELEKPSL
jgi:hypothetical protein